MRLAYRHWYPRADAILCNAGATADALVQDIDVPEALVHHLPNPIDSQDIRAQAAPPMREPGAGLRFVAAGRLTRQKGFDRLLEMVAALSTDAMVKVLGEGPERSSLESQAERLGLAERVRFTGFEPTPWPHYAGADAFLLPSRWEGMPNAALEALACGAPVIAAPEAGGIGEVATAASSGAVTIAECGDPFVAAMMSVEPAPVASQRPSLLPAGFELHAVAARLTEILERIASERVSSTRRRELPVL
jgi:glycosyltransferase involved in cell wall biosynthesis